jgi:molybdate transport system substrate-binding protein
VTSSRAVGKGARINAALRLAATLTAALTVPLLLVSAVSAAPDTATIKVFATDTGFRLSAKAAPAGPVRFVVRNAGKARHNFRIAGKKTRTLGPRQTASLVVRFAKPGTYTYASTVGRDARKGLRGAFRVRPAAPIPTFDPITILAAASLTDVLPALDGNEQYSFAGSNSLATQIRNGVPADVFLSANTGIPDALHEQGFVEQPVRFTRNALVLVVPSSNPAGISSVYDLTRSGVKVDVAAPAVPVGGYTLQILKQMGLASKVLANVVSEETDVRAVLTKVALGQADAGFVYATDARTVPGNVKVIKVPAWAQPKVTYEMAVVSSSPNKQAAEAFMKRVLSAAGQTTLARFGFLPLPRSGAGTGGYWLNTSL